MVSDWDFGKIVLDLRVDPRHLDDDGLVDRGVQASLLDAATGLSACYSPTGDGPRIVTLNLSTHFHQPAAAAGLRAVGRILHQDGKILLAEGRLSDDGGRVLAQASARLRYFNG